MHAPPDAAAAVADDVCEIGAEDNAGDGIDAHGGDVVAEVIAGAGSLLASGSEVTIVMRPPDDAREKTGNELAVV